MKKLIVILVLLVFIPLGIFAQEELGSEKVSAVGINGVFFEYELTGYTTCTDDTFIVSYLTDAINYYSVSAVALGSSDSTYWSGSAGDEIGLDSNTPNKAGYGFAPIYELNIRCVGSVAIEYLYKSK